MTLEAAMVAGLYPVTPSGDAPVSQQQPQQQQVDGADTFSVPANITENAEAWRSSFTWNTRLTLRHHGGGPR